MTRQNISEATPAADLQRRYRKAVRRYVRNSSEKDLVIAYELGRKAFAQNLGILELVAFHHLALADLFAEGLDHNAGERAVKLSGQFLAEIMSAYELGRRSYNDS